MSLAEDINRDIARLTAQIDHTPTASAELYFERGKLYYRTGSFDLALNDFLHTLRLNPAHTEARSYEKLLREIFEFRYKDIYNP